MKYIILQLNFNKYAWIHVFNHCVKNIFCASVEEQAVAKVLSLTWLTLSESKPEKKICAAFQFFKCSTNSSVVVVSNVSLAKLLICAYALQLCLLQVIFQNHPKECNYSDIENFISLLAPMSTTVQLKDKGTKTCTLDSNRPSLRSVAD